jgi:hypothetical protein
VVPCGSNPSTLSPSGSNYGCNAATREYGDLVAMGVLDPTKVTRIALQNAASVAGLMLTTDCMVAELVEDTLAAGGMPGQEREETEFPPVALLAPEDCPARETGGAFSFCCGRLC